MLSVNHCHLLSNYRPSLRGKKSIRKYRICQGPLSQLQLESYDEDLVYGILYCL